MNFFFGPANSLSGWIPALTDFTTLLLNIGQNNILQFGPKLMGMIFFQFVAALVFILYGVLLLGRVIALWMLVILSPLAFVCYVFPATKTIWSQWWSNFFQWCIIVLPAGLFYYIGAKMVSLSAGQPGVNLENIDYTHYISNALSTILVPGLFLFAGFFISLKFAPMGAGAIMNFANKNKGKILGGALGVAAKASGKIGGGLGLNKLAGAANSLTNSTVGQNWGGGKIGAAAGWMANKAIKGAGYVAKAPAGVASAVENYKTSSQRTASAVGQFGEKIGAIPGGTDDAKQAGMVAEESKRIKFQLDRAKAGGDMGTLERIRSDKR